jgi:hypothetical protein
MTGEKKSVEFFFGYITIILVIVSIAVRPDISAPDKLLTVAIISGLIWLGKLSIRMNKDAIERGSNENVQK